MKTKFWRAAVSVVAVMLCGGCLLLASCSRTAQPAVAKPIVLDMTFPFDDATIYWPNAKPFRLAKGAWGVNARGYWYASNEYAAAEHGGTHADAPIHFAKDGRTIDQVPLAEWIGPAVRIDVSSQCEKNRNYQLQVGDIRTWEKVHGRLPPKAWVVMYTGLDTKWYPDRTRVLGTDVQGEAALPHLSFPGFSPAVAEFLVKERDITGLALDTPSIDYGKSADFKVHQILCAANKLALENLAHVDRLPDGGAMLYVVPMMIAQGTGAPARVFAVLP